MASRYCPHCGVGHDIKVRGPGLVRCQGCGEVGKPDAWLTRKPRRKAPVGGRRAPAAKGAPRKPRGPSKAELERRIRTAVAQLEGAAVRCDCGELATRRYILRGNPYGQVTRGDEDRPWCDACPPPEGWPIVRQVELLPTERRILAALRELGVAP